MPHDRDTALAEFRRMIGWIALAGVLMVAGALWYISLYEPLRPAMVIATAAGVFISVLLGCGLFAAAFYSDKSGHDQSVTDATKPRDSSTDSHE
jgi:type VI protein secretion system component VasK